MKLTKTTVEKLSLPDSGQKLVWDSEMKGFGIRLTPTGRTYIAQARVKGGSGSRSLCLGQHGILTADKARGKALKALSDMKVEGKDPTTEKKRQKAKTVTLAEVAEAYIKDHSLKDSSIYDINRHLRTTFHDWVDRPVVRITRDDVLKKFRHRSNESKAQANQGFRVLRALLNYARETYRSDDKPLLLENPVNVLSGAKLWNTIKARTGKIQTEKIGHVWNHLQDLRSAPDQTAISRSVADAICFLLLTGTRKGECLNLKWEHVDLEDGSFRLMDPKNRNPVTLPLSAALVDILKQRPDNSEYVFPGRTRGRLNDVRWSFDKLSEVAGSRVTPHDLRRSFRAIASTAEVEYWKTKLLMNHKGGGDITLTAYTELEDLRYLRDDAEKITQWVLRQAQQAAAGNVTDLITRRAGE